MSKIIRRTLIAASLVVSAVGCELIAGLEDHQLVGSTATDGASNDVATNEASTSTAFTITTAPNLTLQAGASSSLTITIARAAGFSDIVNVTASGLPGGATSNPVAIAGDATTGSITINVDASAPQSLTHISIDGVSGDGKVNASAALDLIVRGPPGSLDSLFGNQGVATGFTSGTNVSAAALALDTNNKILVLGGKGLTSGVQFLLMRLLPSGAVDPGFATGGILTNAFDVTPDVFSLLSPLASGEIQVAGSTGGNSGTYTGVFARVTPAGAFDTSYSPDGGNGNSVTIYSTQMQAFAIDSMGRLYAAGYTQTSPTNLHIERRLASGAPDSTFVAPDALVGTSSISVGGVAVQADGNIVVLVYAKDSVAGANGISLVRFTPTGARDATFGVGGYVAPRLATELADSISDLVSNLVIQPDQKILAIGDDGAHCIVARFLPTGALDAFGQSGIGSSTIANNPTGMAVQSDGKILIAYSDGDQTDAGFIQVIELQRYLTGGLIDPSFGSGGTVITKIAGTSAYGGPVLVQPDGRIVVAGTALTSGSTRDFEIARYWP